MKKYLILWATTLFLTYNGFSQTVTQDSSQIRLPEQVARAVVTDLITGDQAKEENPELKKMIQTLTHKSVRQDSIISVMGQQNQNYQEMVRLKNLEIQAQDRTLDAVSDALRKQRFKTFMYGASTLTVIAASVALFVIAK